MGSMAHHSNGSTGSGSVMGLGMGNGLTPRVLTGNHGEKPIKMKSNHMVTICSGKL